MLQIVHFQFYGLCTWHRSSLFCSVVVAMFSHLFELPHYCWCMWYLEMCLEKVVLQLPLTFLNKDSLYLLITFKNQVACIHLNIFNLLFSLYVLYIYINLTEQDSSYWPLFHNRQYDSKVLTHLFLFLFTSYPLLIKKKKLHVRIKWENIHFGVSFERLSRFSFNYVFGDI